MIDIATVEEYMRAANPIPTLDAVDADELALRRCRRSHEEGSRHASSNQTPNQINTHRPPNRTRLGGGSRCRE